MSHPEGEGAQSGAEGTQSGAGETTGTGDNSNPESGAQSGTETVSKADYEAAKQRAESLAERMKAADQRASKVEQELKQLRDKDMPEAEKIKREFEEAQTALQEAQRLNGELALQVAFLKDNTYTWHNPERALKLVDLSQVEVQPDGTVNGLKDALKALATSDKYLVKTEVEPKEEPPAGTAPGNNGGAGGRTINSSKAASRIPALRTRVPRS